MVSYAAFGPEDIQYSKGKKLVIGGAVISLTKLLKKKCKKKNEFLTLKC